MTRSASVCVIAIVVGLGLCACAVTPPAVGSRADLIASSSTRGMLHAGPSTFAMREKGLAIGITGVGEILVDDDGSCALATGRPGIESITIYEGAHCELARFEHEVCLRDARFARKDAGSAAQEIIAVSGCATENELIWARVDSAATAGVGPRTFHERCVALPKVPSCPLTYARVIRATVAKDQEAKTRFGYDDGFLVCLLVDGIVAYDIEVALEHDCGERRTVRLSGSTRDL